MSLRMLTITFKLFTSIATSAFPLGPTEVTRRGSQRRHICYSLNFYDDGARHRFPLTPSDCGRAAVTHNPDRCRGAELQRLGVIWPALTTPIYEFHLKFTLTFIKATKWMRRYCCHRHRHRLCHRQHHRRLLHNCLTSAPHCKWLCYRFGSYLCADIHSPLMLN